MRCGRRKTSLAIPEPAPGAKPLPGPPAAIMREGRVGFTLLEVLLALMLTSLVLVALSMAVDFHLRVAQRGRTDAEEAQLARTLLHRIADDLRNAVTVSPAQDSAASSGSGSVDEALSNLPDPSSLGLDSLDGLGSTTAGESAFTSGKPGLYGSSDWLQVDVSRVPRLDQYYYDQDEQSTDAAVVDRLSDVKTVTYYVVSPGEGTAVTTDDGFEEQTGLVRRELDRAVTAWADEQGLLDQTSLEDVPEAPEVAAIEFTYFDGTEWVDSWDSEAQGRLPQAVQIGLAFTPADAPDQPPVTSTTTDFQQLADEGDDAIYRLVVHLPGAQAASGGSTSEAAEPAGDSGGLGESGSGQSGTAGGAGSPSGDAGGLGGLGGLGGGGGGRPTP